MELINKYFQKILNHRIKCWKDYHNALYELNQLKENISSFNEVNNNKIKSIALYRNYPENIQNIYKAIKEINDTSLKLRNEIDDKTNSITFIKEVKEEDPVNNYVNELNDLDESIKNLDEKEINEIISLTLTNNYPENINNNLKAFKELIIISNNITEEIQEISKSVKKKEDDSEELDPIILENIDKSNELEESIKNLNRVEINDIISLILSNNYPENIRNNLQAIRELIKISTDIENIIKNLKRSNKERNHVLKELNELVFKIVKQSRKIEDSDNSELYTDINRIINKTLAHDYPEKIQDNLNAFKEFMICWDNFKNEVKKRLDPIEKNETLIQVIEYKIWDLKVYKVLCIMFIFLIFPILILAISKFDERRAILKNDLVGLRKKGEILNKELKDFLNSNEVIFDEGRRLYALIIKQHAEATVGVSKLYALLKRQKTEAINLVYKLFKLLKEQYREAIYGPPKLYRYLYKKTNEFFINQLNEIERKTKDELKRMPIFLRYEWTLDNISYIDNATLKSQNDLCIGYFTEKLSDLKFEIPACISVIGTYNTFFLPCNNQNINDINSMMESLIFKLAFMLPFQSTFTFFDPGGLGKAFPIAKDLTTRPTNFDISRTLDAIMEDMQRIIRKYGLSDDYRFDFNAEELLINEHFEFIFAANFPKGYNRNQIESLIKIGDIGPIAGKYLFIQYNQDIELPNDFKIDEFKNKYIIDLFKEDKYGGSLCRLEFTPTLGPDISLKSKLIDKLKNLKKSEKTIWDDTVALAEEKWWQENSIEYIQTPIGQNPLSDQISIWFGSKHNEGGRPCAHGILAAMTGSGKSNFYHIIILGFAMRYSPKELSFYLIDGKDGVEFQPYKSLPHVEFVSLKSQPKLSRSILFELIEEKERRNELFVNAGTNDYGSYRKKCGPNNFLPRILLLIDEYQELFEGDKDGTASNNLLILAQQGRSAGIHMLLGSQRFNVVGLLHQSSIFANIHLLLAMQMSLTDRQSLNEFGKEGKEMISKCTHPGDIVLNDKSGEDGGNKFGKVALITEEKRNIVLSNLIKRSNDSDFASELHSINIFNGSEQPKVTENPYFKYLVNANNWLSETEFENYARKDVHKGGLGEYNWVSGEFPFIGWLGQEFNVKGHAKIILTRKRQENILLIGNNNEPRIGMLCSLILSLAINYGPNKCVFYLIDKTTPGSPWNGIFLKIYQDFLAPLKYSSILASSNSQAENIFELIYNELQNRNENMDDTEINKKSIFLFSTDIEKLNTLKQVQNKYGSYEESGLGKKVIEILEKGPESGIFSIHSFENLSSMLSVISKKGIELFNHRVVLQMSEDDSYDIIKKREASRLQIEGKKPICAFYLDNGKNSNSIFKPYCINKEMYNEISQIVQLISNK